METNAPIPIRTVKCRAFKITPIHAAKILQVLFILAFVYSWGVTSTSPKANSGIPQVRVLPDRQR